MEQTNTASDDIGLMIVVLAIVAGLIFSGLSGGKKKGHADKDGSGPGCGG